MAHRLVNLPIFRALGCGSDVHGGVFRAYEASHVALKFLTIFAQVIMFSDLETDYINPIDFCNKMNKVHIHISAPHLHC